MFARRYGLVIGIDGGGLSGCVADASAVGAHLESPLGGNFGRVDYLFNGDATPGAIRRALAAASAVPRDLVAVFYAGHSNHVVLQTSGRLLRLAELADLVQDIPAKHRTILLDSCESGAFIDHLGDVGGLTKVAAAPAAFLYALQRQRPALRVATATSRYENAIEVGGRGAFTQALLSAARGATPDQPDEVISLGWALRVASASLAGNGFPRPMWFGPVDTFPFAVSDADAPVGSVGVSVGRDVRATLFGGTVSAGVEIRGRKRLLTDIRHVVVDWRGTPVHEARLSHWPDAAHDVSTCSFPVPGWVTTVPGLSSRLVVRDDRGRLLARRTSPLPQTTRGFYVVT